jgi:two-component system response regulator GlrR
MTVRRRSSPRRRAGFGSRQSRGPPRPGDAAHRWFNYIPHSIRIREIAVKMSPIRTASAPSSELRPLLLPATSAHDPSDFDAFGLIGNCPAFTEALRLIACMADNDAMALIHGETGTGKEIAARAVHYSSRRRAGPFIPVNCAALPDSLVENELFGHTRGAFTDARESQRGLIADAQGGTLFLDEVECLSARGQGVLIRFLQDRVYRPLGGRASLCADVRVITASNRDLAEMVRNAVFRQDLYYRISVIEVTMPPLRLRSSDVLLLACHFMRRFGAEYGRGELTLDAPLAQALLAHDWPGNVRELENLVHRMVLTGDPRKSLADFVPPGQGKAASPALLDALAPGLLDLGFQRAKSRIVADFERAYLTRALEESKGNVSSAASRACKERGAFKKLLKKYGIERDGFVEG